MKKYLHSPDRLNIRKNCFVFSSLSLARARWKERLPLPVETRIVMTIQIVVCDKGNDSFLLLVASLLARALSPPPSPSLFFRLRRYLAIILAFASMEAMAFELLSSPPLLACNCFRIFILLILAYAQILRW